MNLIYEKKIKIVSQVDKKYEQIFIYVKLIKAISLIREYRRESDSHWEIRSGTANYCAIQAD